jgi:hypothetical protein
MRLRQRLWFRVTMKYADMFLAQGHYEECKVVRRDCLSAALHGSLMRAPAVLLQNLEKLLRSCQLPDGSDDMSKALRRPPPPIACCC